MLWKIHFSRFSCQGSWMFTRRRFVAIILNGLNIKSSPLVETMSCQTHSAASSTHQQADNVKTADGRKGKEIGQSFKEMFLRNVKTMNLRLAEDSTPYCSKIIYPGLPMENQFHGNPPLARLLGVLSLSRIYAFYMPVDESGHTLFDYDRITGNSFSFISSSLVNISPSMYDESIPKWPLEVKVEGGHIGRTSMSFVSSMTSLGDPERRELVHQISQVVLVDRGTRRPKPIEDKWRDLYKSKCVRGEPLIIKPQEEPASGPLNIYEVKVRWSDTDNYAHTNFTSYASFAVDAVHDALRLGKLDGILSEDDISSGISKVKLAYLGESKEGDVLKVKVWCVEESERTLLCSMEKDGQVINQITINYHTPANKH